MLSGSQMHSSSRGETFQARNLGGIFSRKAGNAQTLVARAAWSLALLWKRGSVWLPHAPVTTGPFAGPIDHRRALHRGNLRAAAGEAQW